MAKTNPKKSKNMNLTNKLIDQGKQPNGFIGKVMLKIMNSAHKQMTKWSLSKINIADNSIILDIGCGGGKTLQLLNELAKNGKIYGIDYSEESIKLSTKENKKAVLNGKVIVKQGSVSSIPFSDDTFDIITAFQTHYFWPDLKNDIKEVNRVLKPNGQFLLVSELYKIEYHIKEYKTTESMEKLFLNSGFKNVDIFKTNKDVCFLGIK